MRFTRAILPKIIPRIVLIITICITFNACSKTIKTEAINPSIFSGGKALDETSNLIKISPRISGTENALKASSYLAGRLKNLGLEPVVDEFKDITPSGELTFRNVMTEIPSKIGQHTVVLISHYDTKAGMHDDFQGVNDSGSSTGLLLELARVLKDSPAMPFSIILCFTDGEECARSYGDSDGLHGSRRLLENIVSNDMAKKILAVIVVDMIGDRDLSITIPRNSSMDLVSLALEAASEENARSKFLLLPSGITDDHVPFFEKGIPSIDIIDFQFGSQPGMNDYWHTHEDTMDKISSESLETVGRIVIRMINGLPEIQNQLLGQN